MGKLKAIILAAGEGTRMKSKESKVLHCMLGKPVINYVIDAYRQAGCDEIIIVAGDNLDALRAKTTDVSFALQKERRGTGHAVMCAADYIDASDTILIVFGDGPLIKPQTVSEIVAAHKESGAVGTIVSCVFDDPTGYGRIIRENGVFDRIVEQKDASENQRLIKEINTGLACYEGGPLKEALSLLKCDNAQNEYYITDVAKILKEKNELVQAYVGSDPLDFYGINDKVQLAEAAEVIKERINKELMLSGVTIWSPSNTYISPEVIVERGTEILPGTIILGKSSIGEDCQIGPNSTIENTTIGNNCLVENSILREAHVHNNVKIGPFAYLRPGSIIMENAKIGDFVEIKKSTIGKGSKANHLAYIGDAEIGENVNVGCGVITVNYDGKNKFKTVVKDNAFVGSNVNLIAPVTVEEGGYITAGATVTDDVPAGSLVFGRARQVNKDGKAPK